MGSVFSRFGIIKTQLEGSLFKYGPGHTGSGFPLKSAFQLVTREAFFSLKDLIKRIKKFTILNSIYIMLFNPYWRVRTWPHGKRFFHVLVLLKHNLKARC